MKKLTPSELINLTEEKAWEIAGSFGKYLEHNNKGGRDFYDVLEYEPGDILTALLILIRHNRDDAQAVETIMSNIVLLFTSFIPNPEDYKKMLEIKSVTDETAKSIKKN